MPTVDDLLIKLAGQVNSKTASTAIQSDTSHPVGKADDNVQPLKEGERSAENDRDVKALELPGATSAPQAKLETGPITQPNQGTTVSAAGGDPATEDDYKGNKDDAPTTSVMDFSTGEKYAALRAQPFAKLAAAFTSKRDEMLATILVDKQAGVAKVAATATPPAPAPTAAAAAVLGHAAAALAAPEYQIKQAQAAERLAPAIADAVRAGDLFNAYWFKMASDDEQDPRKPGGSSEGPGMHGGPAGPDGGPAGPEMGAPPGGPGGPGGPPPMGAGGPPPGSPGSMGDGDGDEDPGMLLAQLVSALHEIGLPPEQLLQMAQASGGGGAEAPPPPGGPPAGMPKISSLHAPALYQVAKKAMYYKASGAWSYRDLQHPPVGTKAANLRSTLLRQLHEMLQA